ncbi:PREDICTED: prenylcysteine oxidase-like [Polistes dominula]|uniref:Prenylcysteine oxidase-like n=1 Tax=Polistes dominula TaxID=743375 RepID=A0ABM1ITV7_POLDO|nr:PREDICTED: prenylcysteine oxidase-like [Polistes dominula]
MHSYFLPLLTSFLLKHAFCSKIPTPKIAVIGGGIGAASTTHFLTELFNNDLKIDLYEANKIGGRLATIQIDDNEYEAGGSIIHSQNKYMQEFVHLLGMEHKPSREQKFAIWNGTDIIFEASNIKIFTLAKLMYKYGIQPFKLNSYVDSILADFSKIYHLQSKGQSFMNVTSMLMAMNKEFPKLLQVSIKDQLLHLGYAEELIDELVEAPLLADYGQTKTAVHSFVGLVTLSATTGDIWSVKGGNKKVPEHLIYRNVNVNVLSSFVKKIHYETINNFPNYEVHYSNKDNVMKNHYDIVIIATPLRKHEQTHITFEGIPGDDNLTFLDEYQTVIATFIKGDINPNYFGLEEELDCILICNYNIDIRSIGRIDTVEGPTKMNSKIWKIFSNASLPLTLLNNIFLNIEEVKEVAWKAYPRYTTKARLDKFKLYDGLYHVNAIEWVASAMEMSAIAGRNVAILAHDEYLQRFSNQPNTSSTPNTPKDTQKIEL